MNRMKNFHNGLMRIDVCLNIPGPNGPDDSALADQLLSVLSRQLEPLGFLPEPQQELNRYTLRRTRGAIYAEEARGDGNMYVMPQPAPLQERPEPIQEELRAPLAYQEEVENILQANPPEFVDNGLEQEREHYEEDQQAHYKRR